MWPNFIGMTPLKVSSSGAKSKSEKISSVVPFGIGEHHRLADAGRDVAPPLAFDAGFLQPRDDFAGIAAGRDLKRQPRRVGRAAALQHDRIRHRIWWRGSPGSSRARQGSSR